MKSTLAIIAVALALLIAIAQMRHVSAPHEQEFRTAKAHFIYINEPRYTRAPGQVYLTYTQIDRTFKGDCEDWTCTLRREIGGEVWAVQLPSTEYHAVLVLEGWVYDFLQPAPMPKTDYHATFLNSLHCTGHVFDNTHWPPTIVAS